MAADFKPYDPSEIESIRLTLEAEAKEGKPLFFEVKVNGNTRIHKTNKVERFEEMHNFINEYTKELIISVYPDANSNRKEWYKYKMNVSAEALSGGDWEQRLNEHMKLFEERMAAKKTEEALMEKEKQLEHAEQYIEILENQLEELKVKPNHFGNWDLGKLASSTIEGIAVHHPKILENVPVLNGIAKVIQQDVKSKPQHLNGSFEGDVSFKRKTQTNDPDPEMDEHREAIQRLSDFIGEHFDQDQKKILGWVIVALGENPTQLSTVAELLNIDVKARLAEENEEAE